MSEQNQERRRVQDRVLLCQLQFRWDVAVAQLRADPSVSRSDVPRTNRIRSDDESEMELAPVALG